MRKHNDPKPPVDNGEGIERWEDFGYGDWDF